MPDLSRPKSVSSRDCKHVGVLDLTTDTFKRDKPIPTVTDTDTDSKLQSPTGPLQSTMETEDARERRHLSSLKPATQVESNVFDQSDQADMHRHITPESAGVTVKKRSGPATFEETRQ